MIVGFLIAVFLLLGHDAVPVRELVNNTDGYDDYQNEGLLKDKYVIFSQSPQRLRSNCNTLLLVFSVKYTELDYPNGSGLKDGTANNGSMRNEESSDSRPLYKEKLRSYDNFYKSEFFITLRAFWKALDEPLEKEPDDIEDLMREVSASGSLATEEYEVKVYLHEKLDSDEDVLRGTLMSVDTVTQMFYTGSLKNIKTVFLQLDGERKSKLEEYREILRSMKAISEGLLHNNKTGGFYVIHSTEKYLTFPKEYVKPPRKVSLVSLGYEPLIQGFDQTVKVIKEVKVEPKERFYSYDSVKPDIKEKNHRGFRSAAVCEIPQNLDYYALHCKIYANHTVCNQTCIFGYTMQVGIRREMSCNHIENKWSPVENFEECKPFVDCTVTLLDQYREASSKCQIGFIDKGPLCEIFCKNDRESRVLESKLHPYSCDIEGWWSPNLPYCARAGSGTDLVPAPKGARSIIEL